MARRRRKNNSGMVLTVSILSVAIVLSWWWVYSGDSPESPSGPTVALAPKPVLTSDRPEIVPDTPVQPDITEKGTNPRPENPQPASDEKIKRAGALIDAGRQALAGNDLIAARAHFSEAMLLGVDEQEATFLRAELSRIGTETLLSPRIFDGDPLVQRYIIQPGDSLAKIASKNRVSADLLASMNNIANKNLIRAGRTIKLVKGPFSAIVDKRSFSLDVYLGTTLVRHYRVGLGAEGSTPTGEWRVGTKLVNPTYYPPRGGDIMGADDPRNPLGDRWIGLIGTAGNAVGQERYGIHGTIEPESIGREASLGCIRMYNEDVKDVYDYLVEKYSTVTIK